MLSPSHPSSSPDSVKLDAAAAKAKALDAARDRRRALARRALLQGSSASGSSSSCSAASHATKLMDDAFAAFTAAAEDLGITPQEQSALEKMGRELRVLPDAARHDRTLALLLRLFRGCRVRVTEQRLSGCEGMVLGGDQKEGEDKLPVRVTLHDGSTQEVSLRPIHLQLIQGKRQAEEQERSEAAEREGAAQRERLRRLSHAQPHVVLHSLNEELKGKSFSELKLIAEKLDAAELLYNPLMLYDRAGFREGLAEVLLHAEDGADALTDLLQLHAIETDDAQTEQGESDQPELGSEDGQSTSVGDEMQPVFGPSLPSFCTDAQAHNLPPLLYPLTPGTALQGSAPEEDDGALMYGPAAFSGPISFDAAANVCEALPPVGPALPDNDQQRMGNPSPDVATALW